MLTAFRNALWQLLSARNAETGVIETVMRRGRYRHQRGDLRGFARRGPREGVDPLAVDHQGVDMPVFGGIPTGGAPAT